MRMTMRKGISRIRGMKQYWEQQGRDKGDRKNMIKGHKRMHQEERCRRVRMSMLLWSLVLCVQEP